MPLDRALPSVALKTRVLEKVAPISSAVVFGDIYRVDGGYTQLTVELGSQRSLLVDSLESVPWIEARLAQPELDFYKGDFSDPWFMASVRESFDVSVAFDVLLHQAPLLATLHAMLERTERAFCLAQPVLKEGELPGTAVYLPGSAATEALHPTGGAEGFGEYNVFPPDVVNHSHWIWGLTPSFLRAAVAGEGFDVVHEEHGDDLPNPRWCWYGMIAERTGTPTAHWSNHGRTPQPHSGDWDAL